MTVEHGLIRLEKPLLVRWKKHIKLTGEFHSIKDGTEYLIRQYLKKHDTPEALDVPLSGEMVRVKLSDINKSTKAERTEFAARYKLKARTKQQIIEAVKQHPTMVLI